MEYLKLFLSQLMYFLAENLGFSCALKTINIIILCALAYFQQIQTPEMTFNIFSILKILFNA
ncbi:hypothetical protein BOQ64_14620 [Chryseobacterium sp. CH25]|nr:hypothetical protein BOQ64_14620 [Chryseobacterium sp. CH25]RXM64905.1 hypothetical protein BOQ60_12005 [Chryseobacterium sp. CH1]